ncbi:MAG: PorV/PorQ family protein [Ignavibacteria bacterium]
MKKIIAYLFLLLIAPSFGQTKVGSAAATFLTLGIGPKAVSMGGAFIATADDASALFWNPAGISRINGNGAMFAHTEWFADIKFNWTGAYVELGGAGSVGLSINYLNYGEIEVTTNNAQEGTGEMFSPSDLAIGLSYAYNITDRFSIGGTVKYVRETIWNSSADAVAFDVGTLFISDFAGIRLGAAITNFGPDMRMSGKDLDVLHDMNIGDNGNNDQILASLKTGEFPIPLTFKIGAAIDVFKNELTRLSLGIDAVHPSDNAESLNLGGEFMFKDFLFLRGGYKSLFLERTVEGLSLGFGIKYSFDQFIGIHVDYAYQKLRNSLLDDTQHFSIGISF